MRTFALHFTFILLPHSSFAQMPATPADFTKGESFGLAASEKVIVTEKEKCFLGFGDGFTGSKTEKFFHDGTITVIEISQKEVEITFKSKAPRKHLNACEDGTYKVPYSLLVRHKLGSKRGATTDAVATPLPHQLPNPAHAKTENTKRLVEPPGSSGKWDFLLPDNWKKKKTDSPDSNPK